MADKPESVFGNQPDDESSFTDEDFEEFWKDIESLNEDDPIDSEDEAKIGDLGSRDKEYTKLVHAYCHYYSSKSKANIGLRKKFFWFSFILLSILIVSCVGLSVVVCFMSRDIVTIITSIISSIAGIVSSILILPTIIGNYLFPKKEDDAIKELILHFKTSDDERLNKK